MSEAEFLSELVARTDCGLLLDINNVYVNARNLGVDAWQEIMQLPRHAIKEIHLAGYSVEGTEGGGELLIDTHSTRVCAPVWQLYERALARLGPVPTLIEWDQALPELSVLLADVKTANTLLIAHTLTITNKLVEIFIN